MAHATSILVVLIILIASTAAQSHARHKRDVKSDIYNAVINGDEAKLKSLIDTGADVRNTVLEQDGRPALHLAAQRGIDKIVELLLENGFDINQKRLAGEWTPLHDATDHGRENVVRLLIQKGCDLNEKRGDGWTALHIAAWHDYAAIGRLLIQNGSKINEKDGSGWTPLHTAARKGSENMTRLLIQSGANVNEESNTGEIPLYLAAWFGYDNIARLLIQGGSDVNDKSIHGYTPLHEAVRNGHSNIVKMLIESGSQVNLKNNWDWIPLNEAAWHGNEEAAKLLIQNGSDINNKEVNGRTPVFLAAEQGHTKIVRLLLTSGADAQIKDNAGKTPRNIAVEKSHQRIVQLIDAGGAQILDARAACEKYSAKQLTDFILDGQDVEPGEYPWMAALGYFNERRSTVDYRCGGTLISDEFVMTAAHCVPADQQPVIVRLGITALSDRASNFFIKDIIRHEGYTKNAKKNDIALIRLSKKIEFSSILRPACLETDLNDKNTGLKLIVTGWGINSTESDIASDKLMKTEVETLPLSECNARYKEHNRKVHSAALTNGITENQYCAWDPNLKKDSCRGDSGGPLQFFHNPNTSHVVGIVSFGIACASNLPTIYTRVAYYLDWIESHVWQNA